MAEWISVKDRLPKGDGYCLVWYTESNSVEIAWFDYGTRFCKGVTHWQPLPDAPRPNDPFGVSEIHDNVLVYQDGKGHCECYELYDGTGAEFLASWLNDVFYRHMLKVIG